MVRGSRWSWYGLGGVVVGGIVLYHSYAKRRDGGNEDDLDLPIDPARTAEIATALRLQRWFHELKGLKSKLKGDVFLPTDECDRYERARTRPWSNDSCGYPYVIVRVLNEHDVRFVLSFAKENNIPVCVLGGGHGSKCMVTGSLVIDCFYLRSMELSPCNRRLKVGAGVILGEVDKLLKPRNLFVPLGTFWGVGVVGLCLSGGWGWLNGKFGIPALSLIEIEMITSDGTLVVGTPHNSQSDLLWASRGAGGNFGVVLSVTLRVYPLDQYICRAQTAYVCPTNKSISQVMHNFVSVNESRVSPDFGSALLVLPCGGTAVEVVAVSSGNRSTRSIRIVEPFTQCGGWFRSAMELGPCDYYDDMQLITDDVVPDRGYVHTSSAIVDVIDEAIIAILIKYSRQVIPNKLSSINIMAFSENSYKGPSSAICGQPGGESLGTCLKPAGYWITIEGKWLRSDHPQGRGRVVEWCNQIKEELHTVCGNMFRTSTHTMGDDKVAFRVEDIFDKDAAKKLRHIKHKYDPTNMFRANKNIRLHAMPAHE